jgi:ABC-type spermidine/putrescine transport system, permease component I
MLWTFLFVLMPLLYIVAISFMERGEVWGIQEIFTMENYKRIFDPLYYAIYRNSLGVGLLTTGLTLLIGYPFAYGLAKLNGRWKGIGVFFLMAPFWVSSLLRLYGWQNLLRNDGWINKLLTFLAGAARPLKLMNTFGAVMLAMVYALLPIMILAIYNSTEKLDWAQVEAARDLGAGRTVAFVTVTLPQTLPGIVAGCVLVLVPSMGLFFIGDMFGGAKQMYVIGSLIQQQVQSSHDWPFAAALSVVMLLFAMLIIWLYTRSTGENDLSALV